MASATEKGLPNWVDCGKQNTTQEVVLAATKNVKWAAKLGPQTCGSPVVSHGKVYIGTTTASNAACLLCFDEQTGRELGRLICPKPKQEPNVFRCFESWGVCSTPTVEDDRLYFVSPYTEVYCLDLQAWPDRDVDQPSNTEATAKSILWRYDMAKELQVVEDHAASCSVLVHADFVYVCTGNGRWKYEVKPHVFSPLTPSLIVLNKKTGHLVARDDEQIGEQLWRGQWSSPSLGVVNGKTQIYFAAGNGVCYAFAPVDPTVPVPPNRWITTTLRGPIVQYIDVNPALTNHADTTQLGNTNDLVTTNNLERASPTSRFPIETRPSFGIPAGCSPVTVLPTAKVPDVPVLKKIWSFDCIPRAYKTNAFLAQTPSALHPKWAGPYEGGRPCDIIATPVFFRDRVYIAIGGDPNWEGKSFQGNLVCIDATKTGDITQTGRIWSYDKTKHSLATVAIANGLVFALDEAGTLHCLDADTGQCFWTYKCDGVYPSPLVADGKLFAGKAILSASREFKRLSNTMPFGNFSTPCVANGVVFAVQGRWLWALCDY